MTGRIWKEAYAFGLGILIYGFALINQSALFSLTMRTCLSHGCRRTGPPRATNVDNPISFLRPKMKIRFDEEQEPVPLNLYPS